MAGKLRFAAKLFLASSVLAGGGGSAWYFTANGWPQLGSLGQGSSEAATTATDDSKPAPASFGEGDLEAVAGAWAEPTPNGADAAADSSPTARSAEVTAPEVSDERYDAASTTIAPLPETSADAASEASEPPQSVETEVETESDAASAPEPAIAEVTPTPAETNDPGADAIARGQEPSEEPAQITPLKNDTAAAEPAPLAASELARPANSAGAADQNTPTPSAAAGDNRYGDGAALVNPFAAKPSTNPTGGQTTSTIEPLPRSQDNDDIGNQLSELQQPPAESNRSAARTLPTNDADSGRFAPRGVEPRSLDASLESDPVEPLKSQPESVADEGAGQPGERALEGPQRPALEIQKLAPPEIQVGKPAKFVVQVRNVGAQAAEGVTIRDLVPQGTRLISTTPTAEAKNDYLVWELGKLSPGEDRTVELQLMPTSEGEIGSVATVSYAAQASVKTRCTMPQLAIRMTAPNKVLVGQEQRVKIELRNPGSGDATGVMLFENVPQNVKHAAGPALEFEIGTLRAGETRELELVLFAEKAGKTVNVLSAKADGNLQVQQQVEFEVIAPALAVGVSGPERRYLERPATYEVSIENPGTAPAHNVQIVTKLPKGLQFVRANNMGEYDATNHSVHWSLAELPEGESGTVELVAMPIETGPQTLHVEGRAGEGLTDQAERQIVIDGIAAIMFEVRDLEDPIEVGGETGYEIRIVNQGTKAATNVQLAVNLPEGMQLVSAEGETQHADQRGTIVFEPIEQLAAKADSVYRLRVQGNQAGDQRVTVEINTDDLSQPIRREESTRVFGDE